MDNILLATDFSARSDRALRRAVLLARQSGLALTLLHVIDDDQPSYLIERLREAATQLLDDATRTISESDQVPTDAIVAVGDAFAGILGIEEEIRPRLTVLGSHRRQVLDVFVGTTAERTIRRSRRPVLMANSVPAGPYRRTLLAVDFDEASRAAATVARELGLLAQTSVTTLHLFDTPAVGMMRRASESQEAIDHYVGTEQGRLNGEFEAFLSQAGLEETARLLRPHQGSPSGGILAEADRLDCDLIIVGTSQRSGLERFLLGSVAEHILLNSRRDVLVVPSSAGEEQAAQ